MDTASGVCVCTVGKAFPRNVAIGQEAERL